MRAYRNLPRHGHWKLSCPCHSQPAGSAIPPPSPLLRAEPLLVAVHTPDRPAPPSCLAPTTVWNRNGSRTLVTSSSHCLPRHRSPHSRCPSSQAISINSSIDSSAASSQGCSSQGRSSRSSSHHDIELVTQVSLDRWPRFAQQALAWGGPVSVAVYLPCPPDHPLAEQYMQHLQHLVQDLRQKVSAAAAAAAATAATAAAATQVLPSSERPMTGKSAVQTTFPSPQRLTVTVVHAKRFSEAREGAMVLTSQPPGAPAVQSHHQQPKPPQPPPTVSTSSLSITAQQQQQQQKAGDSSFSSSPSHQLSYEDLYPINALRNAALEAAAADYVFLVDGDFIPSRGLREELLKSPLLLPPLQGLRRQPPAASEQAVVAATVDDVVEEGFDSSITKGRKSNLNSSGRSGSSSGSSRLQGAPEGCHCAPPVMWVVPAFELVPAPPTSTTTFPPTSNPASGGGAAAAAIAAAAATSKAQPTASTITPTGKPTAPAISTGATETAAAGMQRAVEEEVWVVPDTQPAQVPRTFEELWRYRDHNSTTAAAAAAAAAATATIAKADAGAMTDPADEDKDRPQEEQLQHHLETPAAAAAAMLLRPFHCGRYPQPVPSLDYEGWWRESAAESNPAHHNNTDIGSSNNVSNGASASTRADVACEAASADTAAAIAVEETPEAAEADCTVAQAAAAAAAVGAARRRPGEAVRWLRVPYHEYFEPYGIVRKDQVPRYDERFRGYGLNKVQHAYHMAAAGFEFRLLARHFCVTLPHARSASYTAVFGSRADPQQRLRVERMYDLFKEEMYGKYGYRYTPPPSGLP